MTDAASAVMAEAFFISPPSFLFLLHKYMKFLNEFKDNDAIKVITGIRRSGKTFLMNMFIDQLKDEG
ncbi:hypothetical protein KGE51_09970 [Lactobacillus amylovorus]|nr:hypothetical protein [Lactobacillus amylovorus]UIK36096.1 hypothetical protein KGE51_09970 [Lactobacillus amylovorus]